MDRRTKRQKLEAMANQSVSPHEAEVARKKLAELSDEKIDELYTAVKTKYSASGWEPASDLWGFNYKRTDPKFPGEDLYGEYIWTYNFAKEKWERHD